MNRVLSFTFVAGVLLASACKPEAVVDDVGINLNVSDADLDANNILITEKNISTEQGNPYGAFLSTIREQLGDEPASIFLETATVSIVGGTQANLEEIYTGVITLTLVDDSAGTSTDIATFDTPTGAGPVELEVNADAFDDEAFQTTLNEGSFKVQLSGAATDPAANIDADLEILLSFSAD